MPRRPRIAIAHFADRSGAQQACNAVLLLGVAADDLLIEVEPTDWRGSNRPPDATRLSVKLSGPERDILQTLLASDALRLDVDDAWDNQ